MTHHAQGDLSDAPVSICVERTDDALFHDI